MKVTAKILLTSFQPWLSHHRSNSSDDLLQQVEKYPSLDLDLIFLRQLPVDVHPASEMVLDAVQFHKPHGIICCGMAEQRTQLSIESCAFWHQDKQQTSVNLSQLVQNLSHTKISHNAGKFVCEGLYYHVLKHCNSLQSNPPCLFVHVPLLKPAYTELILQDFSLIVQHLAKVECYMDTLNSN